MMDAESCFRRMVLRSFPLDSRILSIPRQAELVFAISWPLRWQFRRPENPRRSRVVRLAISEEIVDQYELSADLERHGTAAKVEAVLKHMLADFDPVPDENYGPDGAFVIWQLTLDEAPPSVYARV